MPELGAHSFKLRICRATHNGIPIKGSSIMSSLRAGSLATLEMTQVKGCIGAYDGCCLRGIGEVRGEGGHFLNAAPGIRFLATLGMTNMGRFR